MAITKAAFDWLAANGHERDLDALTEQDNDALSAAAHALRCYAVADADGQPHAFAAIKSLYRAMQPRLAHLIVRLIPWALDWPDERILGPQIDGTNKPSPDESPAHKCCIGSCPECVAVSLIAGIREVPR